MRHQKYLPLPRRISQPPNIRQQLLGTRHVEFPTRQYEVGLYIHFPEYEVGRNHDSPLFWRSLSAVKAEPNTIASTLTTRRGTHLDCDF